MDKTLTSIADAFSSVLQVPGEALRNLTLMIPIGAAKGIFILYFLILIAWVATLPREESVFEPEMLKREVSLKPFAIFSLSLMIVIYMIF
ncbi:MAG TPA: hypothetical protein EYN96_01870 [Candidatus Hydrogenedentes bacterium]|nr:hypothetical protein [Candidatus Hydrogenedentota bacterium]